MKLLKCFIGYSIVLSALAISQAANAGWYEGNCALHSTSGLCIEYQDANGLWWHTHPGGGFKGPLSPASTYTPPGDHTVYHSGTMADFRFCGETTLSCAIIGDLTCDLCLDGRVNQTNTLAQIMITGGDVTGADPLCGDVSMSSFPWYVDAGHNYTSSGGIPITNNSGVYSGNVGTTVFSVGGINVNGDVHDVTFYNNDPAASFFRLTKSPVNNITFGLHIPVCTLTGDLTVTNVPDVNVRYAP